MKVKEEEEKEELQVIDDMILSMSLHDMNLFFHSEIKLIG